jgi:predicted DNA-binding transcriptional regulator YafY
METWGWLDVKKWVLSFGMHAEVLEPKEMKDEIMEDLKNCLRSYSCSKR